MVFLRENKSTFRRGHTGELLRFDHLFPYAHGCVFFPAAPPMADDGRQHIPLKRPSSMSLFIGYIFKSKHTFIDEREMKKNASLLRRLRFKVQINRNLNKLG